MSRVTVSPCADLLLGDSDPRHEVLQHPPRVYSNQITAQPPPPGTPDIGTPALRTLLERRLHKVYALLISASRQDPPPRTPQVLHPVRFFEAGDDVAFALHRKR